MNLGSRLPGVYPSMYMTQPHDTLQSLIFKQYGVSPSDRLLHGLLLHYLTMLNPEIRHPTQALGMHIPRSLNLIAADPVSLACSDPQMIEQKIRTLLNGNSYFSIDQIASEVPKDPESRALFEMMLRAHEAQDPLTTLLGGGLGILGEVGSKAHQATIQQLTILRRQHLNGRLSRQQYNLAQQEVLRQFKNKMGVVERLVYGDKGAFGALYQNKVRGIEPPLKLDAKAKQMGRLAGLVRHGTLLLTGYSVVDACQQMSKESSASKRNEIAYQTLFTVGGGLVVGAFIATGRMGLALGLVAHTAAGYVSGSVFHMAGTWAFDKFGNSLDLADNFILESLCSP